jgi:hypothetical protein
MKKKGKEFWWEKIDRTYNEDTGREIIRVLLQKYYRSVEIKVRKKEDLWKLLDEVRVALVSELHEFANEVEERISEYTNPNSKWRHDPAFSWWDLQDMCKKWIAILDFLSDFRSVE